MISTKMQVVTGSNLDILMNRKIIKEHDSGRHKMSIDVAFKFWKVVGGMDARNLNGIPQVRGVRK